LGTADVNTPAKPEQFQGTFSLPAVYFV
jgi:hypothetical protein